jgi:hypothetical protein
MTRRTGATGEYIAEWRCPACWQQYKAKRGIGSPETVAPASGAPGLGANGKKRE